MKINSDKIVNLDGLNGIILQRRRQRLNRSSQAFVHKAKTIRALRSIIRTTLTIRIRNQLKTKLTRTIHQQLSRAGNGTLDHWYSSSILSRLHNKYIRVFGSADRKLVIIGCGKKWTQENFMSKIKISI